jgi:truncated hemoglobin YjbI
VPEGHLCTKTRLIRAAELRWPVEEDFEFGKGCFGLDQCQARLYTAILRHAVLVMAALAVCAVTAALLHDRTDTQAPPPVRPDQPPPAEPGMIPLTIPEIKRMLAALTTRPPPRWLVLHWDAWTRRHLHTCELAWSLRYARAHGGIGGTVRPWGTKSPARAEHAPDEAIQGEQMTTTKTRSLYDRLGGHDAINALTESWVARVGGDDRANGKFVRTDIPRLMKEVNDQLCEVTGGPCTYTGRSMLDTHAGMKTTAGEFDVVMQHLGAGARRAQCPEDGAGRASRADQADAR